MTDQNTPRLETDRLILRKFAPKDLQALLRIYGDRQANTYLPWFPLRTEREARALLEQKYLAGYARPTGYLYAVCRKERDIPIGYVHLGVEEPHDLGYGLRRAFWGRGFAAEAARAVIDRARADGVPYLTATHDVDNPRSGAVMKKLGMRYQYSYREQWQPKDIPVVFRLYQLNLDGQERIYWGYWQASKQHFVEKDV